MVIATQHKDMLEQLGSEKKEHQFIRNNIIKQVTKKIDNIYKQIKANEVVPKTDYLFNNSINSGNLEKTLNKIDQMNSMNNIIYQKK